MTQRPLPAEPDAGLTKAGRPRQRKPRAQMPPPVTPDMLEGAPLFEPVPRTRARYDGWTSERQRAFIKALAETGCVRRAAQWVGMTDAGAYALRRAEGAEDFRRAWADAQSIGVERLADVAFERAMYGVPVPVFHKGEQVGERRWYNDRLLMFTLRHHAPETYGAMSAGGSRQISEQVEKARKAEWEAERLAAEQAERDREPDARERLIAKLKQMRQRMAEPPGAHSSLAEILAWSFDPDEARESDAPSA